MNSWVRCRLPCKYSPALAKGMIVNFSLKGNLVEIPIMESISRSNVRAASDIIVRDIEVMNKLDGTYFRGRYLL